MHIKGQNVLPFTEKKDKIKCENDFNNLNKSLLK